MGGVEIIRRKRMIFLFCMLAGLVNDGWRTFFSIYPIHLLLFKFIDDDEKSEM